MKRQTTALAARNKTHALWLAGETGNTTWLDARYDETLAELHYLSANRLPGLAANAVMVLTLTGAAFLITWSLALAG